MLCIALPARARAGGDGTVLSVVFADQAARYGVLARLEALGLELMKSVACRRLTTGGGNYARDPFRRRVPGWFRPPRR